MHTISQNDSFIVDREDDRTWERFIIFLAVRAISRGRKFTPEHQRAVREMLHWDIPRHLTDARRLERWISDNAMNTISRYRLFA